MIRKRVCRNTADFLHTSKHIFRDCGKRERELLGGTWDKDGKFFLTYIDYLSIILYRYSIYFDSAIIYRFPI